MKVNEIYIQLALTYRLSLKTMMKLMHKTQEKIYSTLVQSYDFPYNRPLRFLFEYDAVNEDSNTEKEKELKAKEFLLAYKKGDLNKKRELLLNLTDIDKHYKDVIKKSKQYKLLSLRL